MLQGDYERSWQSFDVLPEHKKDEPKHREVKTSDFTAPKKAVMHKRERKFRRK
jgi:hypothetical protein